MLQLKTMKKIYLFILLFFLFGPIQIFAQVTFTKILDVDSTDDICAASIQNSLDQFIMVGTSEPDAMSSDSMTFFFIKTNPVGDTLITYRNRFGNKIEIRDMKELPNNAGYLIAGYNWESGFNGGFPTALVLRTDTDGVILWYKCFVGNGQYNGVVTQITMTHDGNYLLSGAIQNSTTNYKFLVKADINGNIIWAKNYNGFGMSSFIETSGNEIAFCGSGVGGFLALGKMDSLGSILSIKTFTDSLHVYDLIAFDILEDPNGNFILSGSGSDDVDYSFIYLLKTDPLGNLIFIKLYGDTLSHYFENAYGINVSVNQNGYSIFGFSQEQTPLDYPGILIETDTSGNPIRTKLIRERGLISWPNTKRTNDKGYLMSAYRFMSPSRGGIVVKLDSTGGGCNSKDTLVNAIDMPVILGTNNLNTSVPTLVDSFTTFRQLRGFDVYDSCTMILPSCAANFVIYPDTSQLHSYIIVNTATGINPISYLWGWGDGTFDTIPFPTHVYADSGYYDICLTIHDGSGCISTHCDTSYHVTKMSQSNSMVYINVISTLTGIREVPNNFVVTISPNPASHNFTLAALLTSSSDLKISIYNSLAQKMNATIISNSEIPGQKFFNVNCELFPPGIYFVKVQSEDKLIVKKLIVD